jgi:dolichyl-phosphate beta-glucosyltransferase
MATVPRHNDALLPLSTGREHAPSGRTSSAIALSVVIPAFNEVDRLPAYLASVLDYLHRLYGEFFEVLVVDDGSQDGTSEMLKEFQCDWPQLYVLRHPTNRGKGAAVRTGMLAAGGDLVLFADADGATPIAEERKLREAISAGADVATGSRLIAAPGARRARRGVRSLAGHVFTRLVGFLVQLPVRDTQCGFKIFRRTAAQHVFQLCDESGYLFDIQVLLLARSLGYRLAEVGVSWREVPGSKVRLVRDSWKMATGLWSMRHRVARLVAAASRSAEAPQMTPESRPGTAT